MYIVVPLVKEEFFTPLTPSPIPSFFSFSPVLYTHSLLLFPFPFCYSAIPPSSRTFLLSFIHFFYTLLHPTFTLPLLPLPSHPPSPLSLSCPPSQSTPTLSPLSPLSLLSPSLTLSHLRTLSTLTPLSSLPVHSHPASPFPPLPLHFHLPFFSSLPVLPLTSVRRREKVSTMFSFSTRLVLSTDKEGTLYR